MKRPKTRKSFKAALARVAEGHAPTFSKLGSRCGLCGKADRLTRTECCGNWICDDEGDYAPFSYARNSCSRNHRRYTLCGYHADGRHEGDWRRCGLCRNEFPAEMVAYYGTNDYNFVKLQDPPRFEPTRCAACREIVRLARDSYMRDSDRYYCAVCARKKMTGSSRTRQKSRQKS